MGDMCRCDGCGKDNCLDLKPIGKDDNGDPCAPRLCGSCQAEEQMGRTYNHLAGRYVSGTYDNEYLARLEAKCVKMHLPKAENAMDFMGWCHQVTTLLAENGLGQNWNYDVVTGMFHMEWSNGATIPGKTRVFRGLFKLKVHFDPKLPVMEEIERLIALGDEFDTTCRDSLLAGYVRPPP